MIFSCNTLWNWVIIIIYLLKFSNFPGLFSRISSPSLSSRHGLSSECRWRRRLVDFRERGNVLSRPNQSTELQSCYPMCWRWGGLTESNMLPISKWASNLDRNVGNSLGDGRRHAIRKQECLGSRQRKLIGKSITDYKVWGGIYRALSVLDG